MAKILALDVLRRFHVKAPPSMPPLFVWPDSDRIVTLAEPALSFIAANSWVLESLANLWWARYLERVNILAPFVIKKVEREGAQRSSLIKFLRTCNRPTRAAVFIANVHFRLISA